MGTKKKDDTLGEMIDELREEIAIDLCVGLSA